MLTNGAANAATLFLFLNPNFSKKVCPSVRTSACLYDTIW